MCLYQNIHAARHYELLNVNTAERDNHTCEYEASTSGEGEKCPLHSCCRVLGHEVIFKCSSANQHGGNLCDDAMKEDVFVPLKYMAEVVSEKRNACLVAETQNGIEEETVSEPVGNVMMEFWSEDQPGKVTMLYLEAEVPGYEAKKKEKKPDGR
ncbi:hypothetical protein F5B19DRAFT_467416 [Rostrohypoxylon terebratum]|nr:hypothetical protein F5B19DRAFT_467416 [Rostrohypoxylon terebratum]